MNITFDELGSFVGTMVASAPLIVFDLQ